jgi:hypothetical protein
MQTNFYGSKKKDMKLPITFEEFKKNPITAVTFCMLVVVGYLYVDQKTSEKERLMDCANEVSLLKNELKMVQIHQRKNDSALAVAMTELKILTRLGKI